ncbi:hypothetical protein [Pelomonas sp. KK5]|uniref:hypothetical protein n=1 Tax=Pelomonas sp. KK5 TaxID=1855730 RepID=UPI00097C6282|nr:hypothetical protein [Pelomonas sp. KK5]
MDLSAEPKATPSLGMLGITALEEQVYRSLLRVPGSTPEMLAAPLGCTAAAIHGAALGLEAKGFATIGPEQQPRLFPSPPDIAIESLLLHRQKELQQSRLAIADLQREQMSTAEGNPVVEIIDADPAAQAQPYAQSHSRAVSEVLCLIRPPFLVSAPNKGENSRAEARKRGVRYRNIVHPDTLALPGWPEILRQDYEAGEELRLLSDFPFKMIVADRELGLLPLKIEEPQGPMLLLRRSAVLDALCELFETLWQKAVPLHFAADNSYSIGTAAAFPSPLDAMVPLLAAGVNDKVAAERLGMSERTFMRRIDALYQSLDARSRFQAGWLAALRTMDAAKTTG